MNFCNSSFWDWEGFWNSDIPNLDSCFRHSVLVILPCAFLWIATICSHVRERYGAPGGFRIKPGPTAWTRLVLSKLMTTQVLILCCAAEEIYLLHPQRLMKELAAPVFYFSVNLRILTFCLALYLQIKQKLEPRANSDTLSIFWMLFTVCYFFNSPLLHILGMNLDEMADTVFFIFGMIMFVLLLVETVLSFYNASPHCGWWHPGKDEFRIENQSVLSRLLFSYMTRIAWYVYQNAFAPNKLDVLGPEMQPSYTYCRFQKQWRKEVDLHRRIVEDGIVVTPVRKRYRRSPSLLFAMCKAIWPWLLFTAAVELVCCFFYALQPIILDCLIKFVASDEPEWHGYVYAVALFLLILLSSLMSSHNLNILLTASLVTQSGISGAIYRKCFRLSPDSMRTYTVAKVVNMAAVDVSLISHQMLNANLLWSVPLRIIYTITFLGVYLGNGYAFGIAVLAVSANIIRKLAGQYQKLQVIQTKLKELRLKETKEVLNNMKILKFYAHEFPFLKKINSIREKEVAILEKMRFYKGSMFFLWTITPFLIALGCILGYVYGEGSSVLPPSIAFVSLFLSNHLWENFVSLGELAGHIKKARPAFKTVTDFLLCEELEREAVDESHLTNAIEIYNGTFSWSKKGRPALVNISLSIPHGNLVSIVELEKTGKSAVLSAILGEMYCNPGTVQINKGSRFAYVPQTAWLRSVTLRENILFGKMMEEERYDSILKHCLLSPDLLDLPQGDLAEFGLKSTVLSHAQMHRISLARAVYQDADIYLFDNPFSYETSQTRNDIFQNVVGSKGMLKDKTRIIATKDDSIMRQSDQIYLISNGTIIDAGRYQELLDKNGKFANWITELLEKQTKDSRNQDSSSAAAEASEHSSGESASAEVLKAQIQMKGSRPSRIFCQNTSAESNDSEDENNKEMEDDDRVTLNMFWTYFRFASLHVTFLYLAGFAAYLCFDIGSNRWLSLWSRHEKNLNAWVFGILGFGQCLSLLAAYFLMAVASKRASVRFHANMLNSVFKLPAAFFNATSLKILLERFGKDISTVDEEVPDLLQIIIRLFIVVVGSFAVIAWTHLIFLVIVIPICIIYTFFHFFYMVCSHRFRKRHPEAVRPLISFFTRTVIGVSSIRAYKADDEMSHLQDDLVNSQYRVFLAFHQLNRWFEIRLQFFISLILLGTAILSVVRRDSLTSGAVGLSMFYALNMATKVKNYVTTINTYMEKRMVSVGKIHEYCHFPPEAPCAEELSVIKMEEWPDRGHIMFSDYTVRERSKKDFVLRGINVQIPPGQKVAVVGRKGSGKEFLVFSLLRNLEPEDGTISIDGVDISTFDVHDLRSKIAFIPQDPLIFNGSIRFNLDPQQEYSDEDLWRAIQISGLKTFVSSLDGGLDYKISKGAQSLRVGQKHQLSLARAVLKKTRILVWDEDPVAIDLETDELIRNIVAKELSYLTVIAVSHRLYTALDYDRILVMENGAIVEDGQPDDLLLDEESMFYRLCKEEELL